MGNIVGSLYTAFYVDDPRAHHNGTKPFHNARPDNKVYYTGLIFQGDEGGAVGCAWALASENDPRCLDPAAARLAGCSMG